MNRTFRILFSMVLLAGLLAATFSPTAQVFAQAGTQNPTPDPILEAISISPMDPALEDGIENMPWATSGRVYFIDQDGYPITSLWACDEKPGNHKIHVVVDIPIGTKTRLQIAPRQADPQDGNILTKYRYLHREVTSGKYEITGLPWPGKVSGILNMHTGANLLGKNWNPIVIKDGTGSYDRYCTFTDSTPTTTATRTTPPPSSKATITPTPTIVTNTPMMAPPSGGEQWNFLDQLKSWLRKIFPGL